MYGHTHEAEQMLSAVGMKKFYIVQLQDSFHGPAADLQKQASKMPANSLGFTSPIQDLDCKATLQRRYQWKGRRPCCVITDSHISRELFLGTCVHELLGHVWSWLDRSDLTDQNENAARAYYRKHPIGVADAHNDKFVRAVINGWYRVLLAGFSIPFRAVTDLTLYKLSSNQKYLDALSGEALNRSDEPIENVLASTPPREFLELYNHDTGKTSPRPKPKPQRATSKSPTSSTATRPAKRRSTDHVMMAGGKIIVTKGGKTTADGVPITEDELRVMLFGRKYARRLGLLDRSNQLMM